MEFILNFNKQNIFAISLNIIQYLNIPGNIIIKPFKD